MSKEPYILESRTADQFLGQNFMKNLHNLAALNGDKAITLAESVFHNLANWRMTTPEQFRNALINGGGMMVNPLMEFQDDAEMMAILELVQETVRQGCMIDFGHMPNATIKAESLRARHAFESGELIEPFDNWVATYSWDGGYCGQYIGRLKERPGIIVNVEMYGVHIPDIPGIVKAHDSILIYDMMVVKVKGPGDTRCYPTQLLSEDIDRSTANERSANMLDPLVCFLRFLNDASIHVVNVPIPKALNKARARRGKDPLPGHTRVETQPYITAMAGHAVKAKGAHQGGTHASPVAHWRKAHDRHLGNKVVKVRSSKVNFRDEEDFKRLFYRMMR